MNTTVYISRHSDKETHYGITKTCEDILQADIRRTLTVEGEEKAKLMANYPELQNIDVVWSSNYARSIATAKYVAHNNNLQINIDERLRERVIGLDNEFPALTPEFQIKQFEDENYKYKNGESRKEIQDRMKESLYDIINENKGKRIYITSHSFAMMCLFISLGEFERKDGHLKIMINNKNILENVAWGKHTPELFKLVFDENNNIIESEYIKW